MKGPFTFTREQLDWCEQVSRRHADFPYDRDDLYSAAMEAVWVAYEMAGPDQNALRNDLFQKAKADLWRKANAAKRGLAKTIRVHDGIPIQDPRSIDPMLVAMAGDLHRSQTQNLAKPCIVCGTRTGRVRDGVRAHRAKTPSRTKGMCRSCYLKAFKQKKRKDVG